MDENPNRVIIPLVLELIPQEFLEHLGVYLQTCAHIEVMACQFVCAAEGLKPEDTQNLKRFRELRKMRMSDLVALLRIRGRRLPSHLHSEFSLFIDWIDRFKLNRHIASHGAFFQSADPGLLRVQYTHQRRTKDGTEYIEENTVIDRNVALEIIRDADRILRTLFGLVRAIERGELDISSDF